MSLRHVPLVAGLVGVAAPCGGACSRHPAVELPGRVVDDPLTLPRAMMALGTGVSLDRALQGPVRMGLDDAVLGDLRWGVTHRLELRTPAMVSYSILEERPLDRRRPAPLSLALLGGIDLLARGSSRPGLGPTAGVRIARRLLGWAALWVEGRAMVVSPLAPAGQDGRHQWATLGATIQVVPALSLEPGVLVASFSGRHVWSDIPSAEGRSRILMPQLALRLRLTWWADLAASAGLSRTRFERGPLSVASPDEPVPPRPASAWTPGASLLATLRW